MGFTATTADEHIRVTQLRTWPLLEQHEVLGETYWDDNRGARWLLGRPGAFEFCFEVIAGVGGTLLVHGDFETVRFGHCDSGDAWSRLLWMADCKDVGYYVAQKATIGMRLRGGSGRYDSGMAQHDIRRQIAAADTDELTDKQVCRLQEALEHTEHQDELMGFFHSKGCYEWPFAQEFGMVLQEHVIISHLALNRLAWLLRLRHGFDGPLRRAP